MTGTDRLCLFARPWQDAQWVDHPHCLWGRTANVCVADSLRCGRHLAGEKRERYQVWEGTPIPTTENKLRTIVERENMLPRRASCAQQQICLDEITRIQWRALALEFYRKQRISKKARCNIFVARIQSAGNAPLVTRRKCSSTTEYLLSYKNACACVCIERDWAPGERVQGATKKRRFAFTERRPK